MIPGAAGWAGGEQPDFTLCRPGCILAAWIFDRRALLLVPLNEDNGQHNGRDQSDDAQQHRQIGEEQAHGCNGEGCHDHAF